LQYRGRFSRWVSAKDLYNESTGAKRQGVFTTMTPAKNKPRQPLAIAFPLVPVAALQFIAVMPAWAFARRILKDAGLLDCLRMTRQKSQ